MLTHRTGGPRRQRPGRHGRRHPRRRRLVRLHARHRATDWSAHDGFTFWFLGTGGGGQLRYELKSNGQLFERSVTDDTAGWRQVNVAFSQLRLKGNPASDARFDPTASTGFAVTLTDLGAGAWTFDDLGLYDRVSTIEDAEGDVPAGRARHHGRHLHVGLDRGPGEPGRHGAGARRCPRRQPRAVRRLPDPVGRLGRLQPEPRGRPGLELVPRHPAGLVRLAADAPGVARPRATTSRSSSRTAARTASTPSCGPPRSRTTGPATAAAGRSSTCRSRQFTLGGYQPGDAATRNGTLDLTSAWGYALTMVPGTATAVSWAVDDVQLYGSAVPAPTATVASAGRRPRRPRRDRAGPGRPDDDRRPAARRRTSPSTYANGAGTAVAGTHYDAFTGTLTFPAGTASGATQTIDVVTHATAAVDDARTLTVDLTRHGCRRRHQPDGRPQRGRRRLPRPGADAPPSASRTCWAG